MGNEYLSPSYEDEDAPEMDWLKWPELVSKVHS